MSHPHEFLLKDYQYAIKHLPPTVPAEIKAEAQKMHDNFLADPNASEDAILEAMAKTGKAEYPFRHAFFELTSLTRLERLKEEVLEHVTEETKKKLEGLLASGANIEEITSSKMFEDDFTAEERFQIECGLVDAGEHLKDELEDLSQKDQTKFDKLVKKYSDQRNEIEKQLTILKALASHDPKWQAEILEKVKAFESGWLITEPDTKLDTVKKEIEYWQSVFEEGKE